MYAIKRLLVGLDLTEMDKSLVEYTSTLCGVYDIDMVYFLHIAKTLQLPEGVAKKYPDLLAPVDETIEKQIESLLKEHFTCGCDYDIEVKEGNAEDKILRWSKIKEVDLIVMGRKLEMKGNGELPSKLAKLAQCSMLFVPENFNKSPKKIMASVDFSRTSLTALNEAVIIKDKIGSSITVHSAYEVPSGYHTIGKSFEEFAKIMEENTMDDMLVFLNKANLTNDDVEIKLSLDEEEDPAGCTHNAALAMGADLVIIGSKGRTEIASILLGSVASKMIQQNTSIPLMVLKRKAENMGFLEALWRL